MRSLPSVIAGMVALVAALVTVPLLWVSTHVADEDGYVAFSSTLATDDELQAAFAAYLADDYVQRGLLPAALQETAAAALTSAAQLTTNQPGFVEAWEQTQLSLHRSAFSDTSGPLTVDMDPMAAFVASRVGALLPVSLPVATGLQVPIGTVQDRDRVAAVDRSTTFGLIGLMVVVGAAAVSLIAARSRPVAFVGLGLAALATAGILRVVTEIVTPRLIERAQGSTAFSRTFQELLFDRVADSLAGWLGWIAIGGGVALVLGVVGRLVSGRPAVRH